MKIRNIIYMAVGTVMTLTSCDDFLDKMPDNRTEINSIEKVTKLLVSAYPESNFNYLCEMASDNAMDNGATYTIGERQQQEAYLWEKITGTGNDSPRSFWNNTYIAIAAANQALASIDEMNGRETMKAQRGEALMCRAWGHFQLANVFCMAYAPETANTYLGLPYAVEPETTVKPEYTRGTLAELYANMEKDIEEGLPLIDDQIYTVPKYHFTRAAAYAFAARFYLYYQKWDKVIECANKVLGSNPGKVMRDWQAIYNMAADFTSRCNEYVSSKSAGNLLLQTATSQMPFWLGPYNIGTRYGHNATYICNIETYRAGGLWGEYGKSNDLYMANSCWGIEQKICYSKYRQDMQYVDKVNGIGYPEVVTVMLSGPETLLCRAEAYVHLNQYDKAVEDINTWMQYNCRAKLNIALEDVENIYIDMDYSEDAEGKPMPASANNTPKKRLNPAGFTINDETQEALFHCILHMRRCETMQDGLRWQDIKRFGIEIAHNRAGQTPVYLQKDDPRKAFQLPDDVISAGLEANPR